MRKTDLRIAQSAEQTGPRHWKWSVWLIGNPIELGAVKYVEYLLHPTFKEPIRRIDDRVSAFRLDSSGWGEFVIRARLVFNDGSEASLSYRLRFTEPAAE